MPSTWEAETLQDLLLLVDLRFFAVFPQLSSAFLFPTTFKPFPAPVRWCALPLLPRASERRRVSPKRVTLFALRTNNSKQLDCGRNSSFSLWIPNRIWLRVHVCAKTQLSFVTRVCWSRWEKEKLEPC